MPLLKQKRIKNTLILTLNDIKSKNALSPQMAEEIMKSIQPLDFAGFILTHTGDTFCSGGNLSFYKDLNTKEEGLRVNARIGLILNHLSSLPCPKAVFVNGPCFGGGIELLSCFNKIVCTPQSLFGLWQRRVGLTFGWGGQGRLEKRLSFSQLSNWLLDARTISAYQAKNLGLIDNIILSSSGFDFCLDWVESCQNLGLESISKILSKPNELSAAFAELWLADKHGETLAKFKLT